jgi:hypothetical protein
MATYLVLSNRVLNALNEVEMTSANFSSSRGIQTAVKNFVNRGLHDVYNELEELPSLHKETYHVTNAGQREYSLPTADSPVSGDLQWRKIDWDTFYLKPTELITNGEFTSNISSWTNATTGAVGGGTPAYNSGGNGRARLNDAALSQSISTVKNKTYRLQARVFDSSSGGSSLAIKVGTSAHNTTNLSTTLTVSNYGESKALDTTFDATVSTTYVTIINSDENNLDVDYIRISRDISPQRLRVLSYDDWVRRFSERDLTNLSTVYAEPRYVYKTQSGKLGMTPIPDRSDYRVVFEYWKEHTELSAHGDSPDLDDRYADLIVSRASYYAYNLRSDPEHAMIANKEYEDGLKRLQKDLIHKPEYMRDERVNLRVSM